MLKGLSQGGFKSFKSLRGYPPFVDEDPMGIYQKILAGKITFPKIFHKEARNNFMSFEELHRGQKLGEEVADARPREAIWQPQDTRQKANGKQNG